VDELARMEEARTLAYGETWSRDRQVSVRTPAAIHHTDDFGNALVPIQHHLGLTSGGQLGP